MNKKIIILGSAGCLGKQISESLSFGSYNLKKISRKNFNYIDNDNKLFKIIKKFNPKIIINCAAISELRKCRTNPNKAYKVNAIFPYKLSSISQKIGAILIHFSTDAVFEGKRKSIYKVNDMPLPTTVYGKSKMAGERLISHYSKSLIIRLPLLFGKYHQHQVIGILLRKLKNDQKIFVAKDVYSTPINSEDVAIFIRKNIDNKKIDKLVKKKILHLSNNRRLSIFEFMKKISSIIGKSKNVVAVKDSFFNKESIKPKNLGLKANVKFFKHSSLNKFIYN